MLEKLIKSLTPEEAKSVESVIQAKMAKAGTVLIEQGAEGRDIYFLLAGKYDVFQKLKMAQTFRAVKLASIEGPVLFGETSFLGGFPRSASVLVTADAHYIVLSYENFLKIKERYPLAAFKILEHASQVMADRFVGLQQRMQERILEKATNPGAAILWMEKYLGKVQACSPEIAQKLFGLNS